MQIFTVKRARETSSISKINEFRRGGMNCLGGGGSYRSSVRRVGLAGVRECVSVWAVKLLIYLHKYAKYASTCL